MSTPRLTCGSCLAHCTQSVPPSHNGFHFLVEQHFHRFDKLEIKFQTKLGFENDWPWYPFTHLQKWSGPRVSLTHSASCHNDGLIMKIRETFGENNLKMFEFVQAPCAWWGWWWWPDGSFLVYYSRHLVQGNNSTRRPHSLASIHTCYIVLVFVFAFGEQFSHFSHKASKAVTLLIPIHFKKCQCVPPKSPIVASFSVVKTVGTRMAIPCSRTQARLHR